MRLTRPSNTITAPAPSTVRDPPGASSSAEFSSIPADDETSSLRSDPRLTGPRATAYHPIVRIAASSPPNARRWRRLIAALLAVCIGLSSVESLWGGEPAADPRPEYAIGTHTDSSEASAEAPAPEEDAEEERPCLCDCACVNAQRVVQPGPTLVPPFPLSSRSRHARGSPRAPGSVDREPHLRPPRA